MSCSIYKGLNQSLYFPVFVSALILFFAPTVSSCESFQESIYKFEKLTSLHPYNTHLESAASVWPSIFTPELLQLLLELLRPPASHHRLRVADAACETGLRELCKGRKVNVVPKGGKDEPSLCVLVGISPY